MMMICNMEVSIYLLMVEKIDGSMEGWRGGGVERGREGYIDGWIDGWMDG
jgi:hypothetical protein